MAEHHNDAFAVLAGGLTGDVTFHLRDVPGAEPHLVVAGRLCGGRAACEGEKKATPERAAVRFLLRMLLILLYSTNPD